MKRLFVIAACIVLVFVGVSLFVPLSTKSIQGVSLHDASDSFTLEPGKHVQQRFHISKGIYSGIAVYSDDQSFGDRALRVALHDREGNIIAKGSTQTLSYAGSADVLRIETSTHWFTVTHDDFYVVDITLTHGESLPLRVIHKESNLKNVHRFSIDDVSQNAIASVALVQRIPVLFGFKQGILIGCAFLLAVVCISTIQNIRKKYWAAVALIIVFAPLAVLGYWFSVGPLGIADWDFYFTLHDSYRKAILEHHTFPFWNPYICGGTAGLGDPEFPVFSPTFLMEFLFGIPVGIRLAITLSVIVTATGMLALARSLGRSVEAGLLAALPVAFGTVSLLEITEGHVNVLAAMWIPWILWSFLAMYRGKRKPILCGVFLAAAFLGGGIYLLMYTTFAFLALILFVREHRRAAILIVQSGLWAMGFASFKLIPVLYWLKQFPDDAYQGSAYTLPWIVDILFGRYIHGAYIIQDQASGWHEYGAYIGYIVFALSLVGISYIRKSRIVVALTVSTLVALLVSAFGPQLQVVFDPLWFFPRSNISRLILFAVIPLALLAAYGVDRIANMFREGWGIRILLVGFVAIDIISLTYQLSEQAFVLPHVVPAISPAPYPLAYTANRFDQFGEGSRTTRSYDAYKAGYGTSTYCSVLGPTPGVQMIHEEGYEGIVSATDPRAKVSLLSWSYNVVKVHVETPVATQIILNANHVDGWKANGVKTTVYSNRVAMNVDAGSHDIVFQYHPPGLLLGCVLFILTIVVALRTRKRYS